MENDLTTNRSRLDDLISRSDVKALFHRGDEKTFPFSFPGLVTERDVDSIPAVDAVEVRHAEWKYEENYYDDGTYFCSVCHEPWTLIAGTPAENNMNYCPNCGARMDGRREDGETSE